MVVIPAPYQVWGKLQRESISIKLSCILDPRIRGDDRTGSFVIRGIIMDK